MIQLDAYNLSFMLMNFWRTYAMGVSGACDRLKPVPVYAEVNGELYEVKDILIKDGKIVMETECLKS